MDVSLQLVRDADLADLLCAMTAFNAFEQIPWSAEVAEPAVRRLLADDALGVVRWIVDGERGRVGYVVLTWGFDLEWNGRDAFITELWLDEAARGQGIGRRALAAIEDLARAYDAHALHLMVRHENAIAFRLYAGAGYIEPPRRFLSKPLDGSPVR